METYLVVIAICLGMIVIELAVALVFFVLAILHVRQAARAVEVLTYRVDEEVDHFGTVMRSGWVRSIQAMASVAAGFWTGRNK